MGFFSKITKSVSSIVKDPVGSVKTILDPREALKGNIVGDFVGLTPQIVGSVNGLITGNKASAAASSAQDSATDFARQQYEDWQAIYGPIQQNLSSYYSNLTADYYEATGFEAYQQEWQAAEAETEEQLAQHGLGSSGIAALLKSQNTMSRATTRAKIRRDAPSQVAAQQQSFLTIGMQNNAAQNMQGTLNQNAANANTLANQTAASSSAATGQAVSAIGSAAGKYFGS